MDADRRRWALRDSRSQISNFIEFICVHRRLSAVPRSSAFRVPGSVFKTPENSLRPRRLRGKDWKFPNSEPPTPNPELFAFIGVYLRFH